MASLKDQLKKISLPAPAPVVVPAVPDAPRVPTHRGFVPKPGQVAYVIPDCLDGAAPGSTWAYKGEEEHFVVLVDVRAFERAGATLCGGCEITVGSERSSHDGWTRADYSVRNVYFANIACGSFAEMDAYNMGHGTSRMVTPNGGHSFGLQMPIVKVASLRGRDVCVLVSRGIGRDTVWSDVTLKWG